MDEILLKFIDDDWNSNDHIYIESKDFEKMCVDVGLEFVPSVNQMVPDSFFVNSSWKPLIIQWLIRRALDGEVLK